MMLPKITLFSKPKNHIEGSALKVTLFQKVINNITQGKKTTTAGGVTAVLTIIAFGFAIVYPENKISIVLEQNAEAIAGVLIVICTTLWGGFGADRIDEN